MWWTALMLMLMNSYLLSPLPRFFCWELLCNRSFTNLKYGEFIINEFSVFRLAMAKMYY